MIRLATPDDAAAVEAIYTPIVRDTAISFETVPPTRQELSHRIATTLERLPWLVWDDDGVSGYCYASRHRERAAYHWSVDVTVYVSSSARRSGIGRKLYTALFGLLEQQGYVMAFAGITLPNAASIGLHEAIGFQRIGSYANVGFKLGAWHDVGWWQRPIAPAPRNPGEPRDLPEIIPKVG